MTGGPIRIPRRRQPRCGLKGAQRCLRRAIPVARDSDPEAALDGQDLGRCISASLLCSRMTRSGPALDRASALGQCRGRRRECLIGPFMLQNPVP